VKIFLDGWCLEGDDECVGVILLPESSLTAMFVMSETP